MKKNQKAQKQLQMLNEQLLEDTDEADFLVDYNKAKDANDATSEEDLVAVEQVENAGTAKQGERIGAVEQQEDGREPDLSISGVPKQAVVPVTNQLPGASISQGSADATSTIHKRGRQLMVPQRPLDFPGINPRAF
jgi:hypothetical protein